MTGFLLLERTKVPSWILALTECIGYLQKKLATLSGKMIVASIVSRDVTRSQP